MFYGWRGDRWSCVGRACCMQVLCAKVGSIQYANAVLFRLVSTELLEGDFYTCADTKLKKE